MLTTLILHSSGQFIEEDAPLSKGIPAPQDFGSLISYMSRYCQKSALNLKTGGDDDGARAQKAAEQARQDARNASKPPVAPKPRPAAPPQAERAATSPELTTIWQLLKTVTRDDAGARELMIRVTGKNSSASLMSWILTGYFWPSTRRRSGFRPSSQNQRNQPSPRHHRGMKGSRHDGANDFGDFDILHHSIPNSKKSVTAWGRRCGGRGGARCKRRRMCQKLELELRSPTGWFRLGNIRTWERYPDLDTAEFIAHSRSDIELLLQIVEVQAVALKCYDSNYYGRKFLNRCESAIAKLLGGV